MIVQDALWDEVREGLSGPRPRLPSKLFYDDRGARLFEEISRLPEYYPTRTELGILRDHLPEMGILVGPAARVVELGSGSGEKTVLLLNSLEHPRAYIPVDIALDQLREVAARMDRDFPGLEVLPVAADYTHPFELPQPEGGAAPGRPLLFFPGSTIGNFEPAEARDFLRQVGESLGPDAAMLIGVDLVKPRAIVEPAYDDARGVTADFNRNALRNVNRLLGTDFRPEAFAHRAVWNPDESRIEMHLVAEDDLTVTLPARGDDSPPERLRFSKGEHIVTEHSYKYTPDGFEALTDAAGWRTLETWTDPRGWFAVRFLER